MTGLRAGLILVAALATTPAWSQATNAGPTPQCWLAGSGYSPGATVRAGSGVMVCGPDSTWKPTSDEAAGCLQDGKLYSVGAIQIQHATNQQAVPSACQEDGTWKRSDQVKGGAPTGTGGQSKPNPTAGAKRTPEEIFVATDKDHDGKVSSAEFGGSDQAFAKFDTDSDGYLSKSEFLKFREQVKRGTSKGKGGQSKPNTTAGANTCTDVRGKCFDGCYKNAGASGPKANTCNAKCVSRYSECLKTGEFGEKKGLARQ